MTFKRQIDTIGLIVGLVSAGKPSIAPGFATKDAQNGAIMAA